MVKFNITLALAFVLSFALIFNVTPSSGLRRPRPRRPSSKTTLKLGKIVSGETYFYGKPVYIPLRFGWYAKGTWTFKAPAFSVITRVEAENQMVNRTGATVERVNGGVGKTYVSLYFKSLIHKPVYYMVRLYGIHV